MIRSVLAVYSTNLKIDARDNCSGNGEELLFPSKKENISRSDKILLPRGSTKAKSLKKLSRQR